MGGIVRLDCGRLDFRIDVDHLHLSLARPRLVLLPGLFGGRPYRGVGVAVVPFFGALLIPVTCRVRF